ncbi:MAG: hypothetical protein HC800_24615, partial [Phormidesmis sp. RL_2_1]|nr:hypothetical protein [Phormidesmis sp. RL_2_1]
RPRRRRTTAAETATETTKISPFCETLQAQFNPFTNEVDLALFMTAIEQTIEQGGDLNQLCTM